MKKVFAIIFSAIAICFFTNNAIAQTNAQTVKANKYVTSSSNAAVKIHQPNKADVKNALLAKLEVVNASTSLTAAEKQAIIDKINAKLALLEN